MKYEDRQKYRCRRPLCNLPVNAKNIFLVKNRSIIHVYLYSCLIIIGSFFFLFVFYPNLYCSWVRRSQVFHCRQNIEQAIIIGDIKFLMRLIVFSHIGQLFYFLLLYLQDNWIDIVFSSSLSRNFKKNSVDFISIMLINNFLDDGIVWVNWINYELVATFVMERQSSNLCFFL